MKDEWHYDGRYYLLTTGTEPDAYYWELEDAAPTPGRGIVLMARRADADGSVTVSTYTEDPLPIELVHRFVSEIRADAATITNF